MGLCYWEDPFSCIYYSREIKISNKKSVEEFLWGNHKSCRVDYSSYSYLYTTQSKRVELYVTANCCLKAALIIGLTILYRQTNPDYEQDEFSSDALLQQLYIARSILYFYSSTSPIADRFHSIVSRLVHAVKPEELSLPVPTPFNKEILQELIQPLQNMFHLRILSISNNSLFLQPQTRKVLKNSCIIVI